MKKLSVIAVATLAACTGCGNQDINDQEPQTDTPTVEYKLIGRYNYGGNACDWGDNSLVPLEAVHGQDGWLKATIGVPDSYVDFKIYRPDSGVSTGNSISGDRKIVGTVIPVDADGSGHNFTIYSNRSALDVYYSPSLGKLFSLPEGSAFVVPTTEAGSTVDEYALIGKHAGDDAWSKDLFLEAVYSFDDWRVVRIGTSGTDPGFSFKFRRNESWTEQVGGIYNYDRKANTYCYGKTVNNSDISFSPGAAGDYDIYLNKNLDGFFALPAGTAFNIPGRKEQEDLVSLLYIIGGLNEVNWWENFPLEFPSADNHDWYVLKNASKNAGWGALVFKIYNGSWGKGLNVGFSWSLNPDNYSFIGDMGTLYPLWLRDGDDDIPNIQLGTDGKPVDIYIKADLSEIFTLSHGADFVVPNPEPTEPPKAVFIGDSITQFWNHPDRGNPGFFSSNNYKAKGIEGQTSATIKNRFNWDVIALNPAQVHILCGANDLAGNDGTYVAPADICQNIADMASAAKAAGIEVFIGSLLPCNYFWWNPSINPADNIITVNGLLKSLCANNGYTYINYYDALVDTSTKGLKSEYSLDGCHPTKAAYSVMEGIVKPILEDE